jgi:hypothetical protein
MIESSRAFPAHFENMPEEVLLHLSMHMAPGQQTEAEVRSAKSGCFPV